MAYETGSIFLTNVLQNPHSPGPGKYDYLYFMMSVILPPGRRTYFSILSGLEQEDAIFNLLCRNQFGLAIRTVGTEQNIIKEIRNAGEQQA